MNYRYKTIDMELIVSEAEHTAMQDAFKAGQTTMSLRGGKIGINMATASWKPTFELTEPQEAARSKQLVLGQGTAPANLRGKYLNKTQRRQSFCDYRKKVGWEHPDMCICNDKSRMKDGDNGRTPPTETQ